MTEQLKRVHRAIDDIRAGRMVILVDDEDRENEGDLVMAAEATTPDAINFMATHGRGLICLTLTGKDIDRLHLPMMVKENKASLGTAFTVSIEATEGVTTGISAKDRSHTILTAVDPKSTEKDLVSPGHIFPLRAKDGGVLVRTGQTEGSVDLAKLAGRGTSGVICEIMRDDGEMARMPDLEVFAKKHDLCIVSVADLIAYRMQKETIIRPVEEGEGRPHFLKDGPKFRVIRYISDVDGAEYIAFVRGDVEKASSKGKSVLTRVHSVCPLADSFALRPELRRSFEMIDKEEVGVFLMVKNQKHVDLSRSFGKYILGKETKQHDKDGTSEILRDFGIGAQVLRNIGCKKIRLLSNNERKIVGIEGFGIQVDERVAIASANLQSVPQVVENN